MIGRRDANKNTKRQFIATLPTEFSEVDGNTL